VIHEINDNAYRLDLLIDYAVNPSFNVYDLTPSTSVANYEEE